MAARHAHSGKFAALGRQPRTPHTMPEQRKQSALIKAGNVNAAFNKAAQRAGGPARGATPGQIVATVKVS